MSEVPTCGKIALLAWVALLVSCEGRQGPWMLGGGSVPATFGSNGERIYFTATSASGDAITALGGGHMGLHMQMHGGGCATCHGVEREGRRLWPRFWVKAPALTARALFADEHGDHGHDDHGNYDAVSLRRAITDGVNPAGKPLDPEMPRWSISDRDLDDLVAYLQH